MTNVADLALVVELACLTEDRSDAEQRALLRIAAKVDNELNAGVSRNERVGPASRLADYARGTRVFVDNQRAVDISPKERAVWQRKVDRWRETSAERREAEGMPV